VPLAGVIYLLFWHFPPLTHWARVFPPAACPERKPSGLPFNSKFTDVAYAAGLRSPVIYGPIDHNDYILETVGCGIAFFDYDHDGWLDIFVPCGTRLDGDPNGATNLWVVKTSSQAESMSWGSG
jgi:hypothetical protein